jgi:aryl-alcohol dehydrogenase-like predicted oxidoreductase
MSFEKNSELAKELQKLADTQRCTFAQLALSRAHHSGKPGMPFILLVVGVRSESRVPESFTSVQLLWGFERDCRSSKLFNSR